MNDLPSKTLDWCENLV